MAVHTYNVILFSLEKMKEILPFVTAQMNLEDIVLSEGKKKRHGTNTT